MTDSQKLLAEYVKTGSETAFRELVTRYLDLVFSVALRLVGGDTHRAEDVAQTVFVDLARTARTLSRDVMLGSWLHRHTCFVAVNTMRGERRRQSRERQAVEMNALHDHSETDLTLIAPILDEAINQLGEADRMAVLLRFFEQRDFRSVGEALGSNEDAARMRVTRALEKLHSLLKHRGVTTSAAALGVALSANALQAAPAGLAVSISAAALAGTTVATTTTATITKAIVMTTLQKTLITAVIVVTAVGAGIYEARQAATLQSQVQTLQQQQAPLTEQIGQLQRERDDAVKRLAALTAKPKPRLPAPPMQVSTQPNASPTEDLQSTNLYARLKDKDGKLTLKQVESYLKANGRNATSLLAAYRTSGDPALLQEAMQKYPNDPQVAFEAVFKEDASPAERRQWLDAFKQSAPDNALANYFSALDYFKAGQTDQAVQELVAASGKQQFQYSLDRYQDDEEAYLAAGYSEAEAKRLASAWLAVPQAWPVKQLGQDMVDLANSYRQAGDEASAQVALQMAANIGQQFDESPPEYFLLSQLVGMAVERMALSAMDPNSPYGGNGQTVQDRLNQIAQQRAALRELGQQADPLMQKMSDQDWISYTDRRIIFGEEAAMRWLVSKYGQK